MIIVSDACTINITNDANWSVNYTSRSVNDTSRSIIDNSRVTIQIDEIDHFMIDDDYNMFMAQATNYSNMQNKPKLLVYFKDTSLLIRYIK